MKFSLITPSHRLTYVPDLYKTILEQTYENWEWILYLNGSAIREADQLPQYLLLDDRVKIIRDDTDNTNVGYLKNMAFNRGTGDILVEVDHDDLLTSDCLQSLYDAYQEHPEAGFIYSDNAKMSQNGDFVPYSAAYGWEHTKFDYKGTELPCPIAFQPNSQSMAFIWYEPDHVRSWRADIYKQVGGHDVTLSVLDDQDLLIRTYLVTRFYKIPKCLYVYRIFTDNTWLQRNAMIQTGTVQMYHKYAFALAERDADLKGLLKIDLGGGFNKPDGYLSVDLKNGDITANLEHGIPLDDNSVGVVRAWHILEHLKNPVHIMSEIHRVLCDGGWAMIQVPSTEGRGAFQDPTHISYWNQNSFLYYTDAYFAKFIYNNTTRFQSFRCETYYPSPWWENLKVSVVETYLSAIKSNERRAHLKLI